MSTERVPKVQQFPKIVLFIGSRHLFVLSAENNQIKGDLCQLLNAALFAIRAKVWRVVT
jgi:hypothetical protein